MTRVKRKVLALTLIVAILVMIIIAALVAEKAKPSSSSDSDQNGLFIASFSPNFYGNDFLGINATGCKIVLVNPTSRYFENLTLTVKVDNSNFTVPNLMLSRSITVDNRNFSTAFPVNEIGIDPYQNETISLDLSALEITSFNSHVLRIYLSQNTFGDVINGQLLTIPQKKAYLQIVGYSLIQHDNYTWHEYYNSTTNRYEYVNDQPNFYQQNHSFLPLDPTSYNWSRAINQIGEHYFNVTVYNNNTFPVKGIALFSGESFVAFASSDTILQSNESYTIAVQASGENWWSVEDVYHLSDFFPDSASAIGDLIS